MARGTECECHVHDTTIPQERHHVWPKGYHGPNTPDNLVTICCNAHSDIHYYMEYLFRHNGETPADWRTYGPTVRALAKRGYDEVIAYGESIAKDL